jgi:hypothetical protein
MLKSSNESRLCASDHRRVLTKMSMAICISLQRHREHSAHPFTTPMMMNALLKNLNILLVIAIPNPPSGMNPTTVSIAPNLSPPAIHPIPLNRCVEVGVDEEDSMRRRSTKALTRR